MSSAIQNVQLKTNGCRKLNQFGDHEDVSNMTVEDWDFRWSLNQTKFHMPMVHPMLKKHINKLTNGKKQQRVFLPLCGKSLDLKWLLDEGHKVVGNDCVDEACKEFFAEQKIPYKVENLEGVDGVVYKATNGLPIELYRCDCFDLNSKMVGEFDCIWDRGGFVALPVQTRKRYANTIRSLMSDKCRYMLDCFLVDNTIFGGPPFNCTEADVKSCFGEWCKFEKIEIKDVFGKWQESWGVTEFIEEVYMLNPK